MPLSLPMCAALYIRIEVLTSEGKMIKNKEEILNLLCAVWLPHQVAIIHCPGHQREGQSPTVKGNHLANRATKEAAERSPDSQVLALT